VRGGAKPGIPAEFDVMAGLTTPISPLSLSISEETDQNGYLTWLSSCVIIYLFFLPPLLLLQLDLHGMSVDEGIEKLEKHITSLTGLSSSTFVIQVPPPPILQFYGYGYPLFMDTAIPFPNW
jgi:hypothetical protein